MLTDKLSNRQQIQPAEGSFAARAMNFISFVTGRIACGATTLRALAL
jgi:hypothetical protein